MLRKLPSAFEFNKDENTQQHSIPGWTLVSRRTWWQNEHSTQRRDFWLGTFHFLVIGWNALGSY